MHDQPTVRAPKHFILLRRYGEQGTREYDAWNSELPTLFPGERVGFGGIQDAVDDARKAAVAGKDYDLELTLKVAEGTALYTQDALALIEANGRPDDLDLSGCDLKRIDLSRATIQKKVAALVEGDQSQPPPWLSDATEGVNLAGVRLFQARLLGAKLDKANLEHADLREACIGLADLTEARLDEADLDGASLEDAQLCRASLRSSALTNARLDSADFGDADLSFADLRGAHINETAFIATIFCEAHLEGVDLYDCPLQGAEWHGAFLDRTRMRGDQIGSAIGEEIQDRYEEANEAYLLLKINFLSLGRYQDAAWAYVKEQRMERAALWDEITYAESRSRPLFQACVLWAVSRAWDALTGYGETPQKPLGLGVILAAIFFPLLYWATGALPGHSRAFTSSSPSDIDWAGWGDSFVFSLTSFGTLSFSRLQPEGTLPNLIASFEAMIGVLLFALFVFTLGNRMSRS